MNAVLSAMLSVQFVYMVSLVALDARSILFIMGYAVGYVVLFSFLKKTAVHALYAFIFISLFFPKSGNNFRLFVIETLPNVTLFTIVQCVAALAISLNNSRVKQFRRFIPPRARMFDMTVFMLVVLMLVMSLIRYVGGDYLTGLDPLPEEFAWEAQLLAAFVFFRGCMVCIKSIKQIEAVLAIFLLAGLILSIESILYFYLGLPLPLRDSYVFHESGRYHSMFFFDFVSLVFVVMVAIGAAFYFASATRWRVALVLMFVFILPVVATLQRGPALACIIIMGMCFLLKLRIPLQYTLSLIAAVVVSSLLFLPEGNATYGVLDILTNIRPDYLDSYSRSFESRLGSQLRGLEVLLHAMPCGSGSLRMSYLMVSQNTPQWFSNWVHPGSAASFYEKISSGAHTTGSHNFFINLVGEYGLLGLISIGLAIKMSAQGFRFGVKKGFGGTQQSSAFVAVNAIMAGFIFMGLFYHSITLWIIFLLVFLGVFVVEKAPGSGSSVAGSRISR